MNADDQKIEAATIAIGRMVAGYDRPIERRDYRPMAIAVLTMVGVLGRDEWGFPTGPSASPDQP